MCVCEQFMLEPSIYVCTIYARTIYELPVSVCQSQKIWSSLNARMAFAGSGPQERARRRAKQAAWGTGRWAAADWLPGAADWTLRADSDWAGAKVSNSIPQLTVKIDGVVKRIFRWY